MWNLTSHDINRIKGQLQARKARIDAKYAEETKALDADFADLETLERVAAVLALKYKPDAPTDAPKRVPRAKPKRHRKRILRRLRERQTVRTENLARDGALHCVTARPHPRPSDGSASKIIAVRCRRRINAAGSAMPAGP